MITLLPVHLINPGTDRVMCTTMRKNCNHTDELGAVTCEKCKKLYALNTIWWGLKRATVDNLDITTVLDNNIYCLHKSMEDSGEVVCLMKKPCPNHLEKTHRLKEEQSESGSSSSSGESGAGT